MIETRNTRKYYKIRLLPNSDGGYRPEFYSSRNGTSEWNTLSKVKSILTRGIPSGHRGQWSNEFKDYEIVEYTEHSVTVEEVINIDSHCGQDSELSTCGKYFKPVHGLDAEEELAKAMIESVTETRND